MIGSAAITSIPSLSSYVACQVQQAPGANRVLPDGRLDVPHHQAIDQLCSLSANYCATIRPDANCSRARKLHDRRVARRAKKQLVGMGIAFVIGEAVLSWLVCKFLDAFWAWYWGEPKSVELCGAMCSAVGIPAWSDEE